MRRPPFKIDGRSGALRYTDAEGKNQHRTGRISWLWGYVFPTAILAGTGRDFEIRLGNGPWHRINATPLEVREQMLANDRIGVARGIIRRCRTVREARIAAGRPVTGEW